MRTYKKCNIECPKCNAVRTISDGQYQRIMRGIYSKECKICSNWKEKCREGARKQHHPTTEDMNKQWYAEKPSRVQLHNILVISILDALYKEFLDRLSYVMSKDGRTLAQMLGKKPVSRYIKKYPDKNFYQLPEYKTLLSKKLSQAYKDNPQLKEQARIRRVEDMMLAGIFPNYNMDAVKLIDKWNQVSGSSLQHALNGGKYCINGFWLDGYDAVNRIAFEYNEPYHYSSDKYIEKDKLKEFTVFNVLKPLQYIIFNEKLGTYQCITGSRYQNEYTKPVANYIVNPKENPSSINNTRLQWTDEMKQVARQRALDYWNSLSVEDKEKHKLKSKVDWTDEMKQAARERSLEYYYANKTM